MMKSECGLCITATEGFGSGLRAYLVMNREHALALLTAVGQLDE